MIKLFFEEGGAVASMTDKRRNGDIEVRWCEHNHALLVFES